MPTEPTDFKDDWESLRGNRNPHQARPRATRPRTNDPALVHFLKVRKDLVRRYDLLPAPVTTLPINLAVDVTGYGAGAFVFGTALADALIGRQWPDAYTYLGLLGFRKTSALAAIISKRGAMLDVEIDPMTRVGHIAIVLPARRQAVGLVNGQLMVRELELFPNRNRRAHLILVRRLMVPARR